MLNTELQAALKEKMAVLEKNKFSEQAFFDFFGSLNEAEIRFILGRLSTPAFSMVTEQQKLVIKVYLEKLLEKILEKKRQA